MIGFLKFMLNVFVVLEEVYIMGLKFILKNFWKILSRLGNYNFKDFKFVEMRGFNCLYFESVIKCVLFVLVFCLCFKCLFYMLRKYK